MDCLRQFAKKNKMVSSGLDRYIHSRLIHGFPSPALDIRFPGQNMSQTTGRHIDTQILVDVVPDLRHHPRAILAIGGNDACFEIDTLRKIQNWQPLQSEIAIGIDSAVAEFPWRKIEVSSRQGIHSVGGEPSGSARAESDIDIGGIGRLLSEIPEDLPCRNAKAVIPGELK
jgi:hypothetical protein